VLIATQIVDWHIIFDIVVGALVAGVGVTTLFAFAIVGASGFSQARRESRGGSALVYGALTALSLTGFFAGVVVAVIIMVDK
jgi:hypothetical protein